MVSQSRTAWLCRWLCRWDSERPQRERDFKLRNLRNKSESATESAGPGGLRTELFDRDSTLLFNLKCHANFYKRPSSLFEFIYFLYPFLLNVMVLTTHKQKKPLYPCSLLDRKASHVVSDFCSFSS